MKRQTKRATRVRSMIETEAAMQRPARANAPPSQPTKSTVAKVSHTLEVSLAERLREFAFRERISESAVIEFALTRFFRSAGETALGSTLRTMGAGKRRKV